MRTIFCLAALLLALPAPAQGLSGIATQHYGQGCNPVFPNPPAIGARLDTATQVLTIRIDAFPGCCNTFLVQRLLALGSGPTDIPLPWFGPGCALLVHPRALVILPPQRGDEVSFPLPPGLPPLTFYAQGAAHYFTTIGLTHDLALSDGLRVDLF